MTSYTKKLYARDPAAALAFFEQSTFETKAAQGRTSVSEITLPAIREWQGHAAFEALKPAPVVFGKRAVQPAKPSVMHTVEVYDDTAFGAQHNGSGQFVGSVRRRLPPR